MFLTMKENFTQYTVWLTLCCNTTLWHRRVYYVTLWLDRKLIIAFFCFFGLPHNLFFPLRKM